MNLASVWSLPAIFVAENNGYAESTASAWSVATDNIADRAAAFGMPGVIVDGFDFFAVHEAAREAVALYDMTGPVPEERYTLPFGEAAVVRDGSDVTVVTLGRMVHTSLAAAEELAGSGISCEVVDLRTTSPLDEDTILESVENTGRLVVVDEATPRCSMATDISALAASRAFGALRAPIGMVTAPHTPVPFSAALEDQYIPDAQRIVNAVKPVTEWRR